MEKAFSRRNVRSAAVFILESSSENPSGAQVFTLSNNCSVLYSSNRFLESSFYWRTMRFSASLLLFALFVTFQSAVGQSRSRPAIEFYNRGIEKQVANDLDGALADYDKSLEFDPKFTDAYNNRANVRMAKGDKGRRFERLHKSHRVESGTVYAVFQPRRRRDELPGNRRRNC